MTEQPERIKVLFRLRSLEMGGVQKVILDLLENLSREKFDITFLVNLKQGDFVKDIPKHIRFVYLAEGKENFSKQPIIYYAQLIIRGLKLKLYKNFPKLYYSRLGLNDFDVEIAASYSELEEVLNSPNKKSKKIGWFHTDIRFVEKSLAIKFIHWMHQFDVMIFGAKQTMNVLNEMYQETFPNGRVIYNVIDREIIFNKSTEFKVDRTSEIPQFISVARLQKRKNFDTLVRVHKRLLDEGFVHEIVVIGDGDHRQVVEEVIEKYKVNSSFLLLGTKKNPYPYLVAADYFVLPSKTESYPLIIGESLSLGIPVLSTNVGGINEMIDHDFDGMLVDYTEDAIYEGMKRFLKDRDYVFELKNNAANAYKKFNNKAIYKQVEQAIEE